MKVSMADTEVIFYAERGEPVAANWLAEQPRKVQEKFDWLIERLEESGSSLKRPHAAPLRDGIYELRARHQSVNYRLLYFFADAKAVLAHGCTKEGAVESADINRAIAYRNRFIADPVSHMYTGE